MADGVGDSGRAKAPASAIVEAAIGAGMLDRARAPEVAARVSPDRRDDPLAWAQALVASRLISAAQLVELELARGAKLFACSECGARLARADIADGRCPRCRSSLEIEAVDLEASVSDVEVLSTRNPLDLSIPLSRPVGGSSSAVVAAARRDVQAAPGRLRRYVVRGRLGRGGVGVVLEAEDTELRRTVAIKIVRPGPSVNETTIARFVREGRSAARLIHPGIVRVHELGQVKDFLYMVMERVEGRSLASLLVDDEPLPVERATRVIDEVLDAVGYAHGEGVIHRDLKPGNVIIRDEDGAALLIDFGLARDTTGGTGTITGSGQFLGTPAYASPEHIQGAHDADPRSDIFSIGVMLYECLTGRTPFSGESAAELMARILHAPITPPTEIVRSLPPGYDDVIEGALARDPANRFPSADAFRRALAAAARGERIDEGAGGSGSRRGSRSGAGPASTTAIEEVDELEEGPSRVIVGAVAAIATAAIVIVVVAIGMQGRPGGGGGGGPRAGSDGSGGGDAGADAGGVAARIVAERVREVREALMRGRLDRARELLAATLGEEGGGPAALRALQAAVALEDGDPARALQLAEQAATDDGADPDARLARAFARAATGAADDALGDVEAVIAADVAPHVHLARRLRALLLAERGEVEAAEAELVLVRGAAPDDGITAWLSAAVALRRRELAVAVETAERAAALEGADEASLLELTTVAHLAAREVDAGEASATRLIEDHPDEAGGWALRGVIRWAGKRRADGLADLERALPLDREGWASACLGAARLRSGDAIGALAAYDRALELAPELGGAIQGRGLARVRLRQFDDALIDLQTFVERVPHHAVAKDVHTLIASLQAGETIDATVQPEGAASRSPQQSVLFENAELKPADGAGEEGGLNLTFTVIGYREAGANLVQIMLVSDDRVLQCMTSQVLPGPGEPPWQRPVRLHLALDQLEKIRDRRFGIAYATQLNEEDATRLYVERAKEAGGFAGVEILRLRELGWNVSATDPMPDSVARAAAAVRSFRFVR